MSILPYLSLSIGEVLLLADSLRAVDLFAKTLLADILHWSFLICCCSYAAMCCPAAKVSSPSWSIDLNAIRVDTVAASLPAYYLIACSVDTVKMVIKNIFVRVAYPLVMLFIQPYFPPHLLLPYASLSVTLSTTFWWG